MAWSVVSQLWVLAQCVILQVLGWAVSVSGSTLGRESARRFSPSPPPIGVPPFALSSK